MGWIYKTIDFCAGIPSLIAGFVKALPRDEPPQETARALDTAAAVGELQSVADINTRLDAAISEYNSIAGLLTLPDIRRTAY